MTKVTALVHNLRRIRARRGWTSEAMASYLTAQGYPVDRRNVDKWLAGNCDLRISAVRQLAKALSIDPGKLAFHRLDLPTYSLLDHDEIENAVMTYAASEPGAWTSAAVCEDLMIPAAAMNRARASLSGWIVPGRPLTLTASGRAEMRSRGLTVAEPTS